MIKPCKKLEQLTQQGFNFYAEVKEGVTIKMAYKVLSSRRVEIYEHCTGTEYWTKQGEVTQEELGRLVEK